MTTPALLQIADFAEALRGQGMTVTPDQMADMARSVSLIDPAVRSQLQAAWRSLAITDPSHRVPFDDEFARFFGGEDDRASESALEVQSEISLSLSSMGPSAAEGEDEEARSQSGASSIESIAHRDFAELDSEQLAEAKRLVMTMLWEPSDYRTRRWAHDVRGPRPDMRRTLGEAVTPEGDLLELEMRRRRVKRRPLVLIADISGSMEKYSEMFLVFAHAAMRRLDRVEVFTFSTRLTRITDELRRRDTGVALAQASSKVEDWSGGTKIGEAFREWNRGWSRRLARGGPVTLILSDGWDCGDPGLLGDETARLARSVHRLLWLNPLAGRKDYQPATRGMRAALPHIDQLLPAASVADLKGVVRVLDSISTRR